jgi:RimJ/RimL family protein N-acetyltransferase
MIITFPPDVLKYNLELVDQKDIAHLIDASQKEGILPSKRVQYMVLKEDNEIKAIGGFIIKGKTALLKGDYTPEPFRKKGYGKKLLNARMYYVYSQLKVRKVTAHCTTMSVNIYKDLGFKEVQTYKNGITSVEHSFYF